MYLTFIVCLGRAVFEDLDNENVYISLDLEKLFDTFIYYHIALVSKVSSQAVNKKEQCLTCVIIFLSIKWS